MPRTAKDWVQELGMQPHPEGGFYVETYRAEWMLNETCLPDIIEGQRPVCTAIYYLLTGDTFSAFHRLRSDEAWHFYDGSTLTIYGLDSVTGRGKIHLLGVEGDARPQVVIPAGQWFAASVNDPGGFALVGCTVSPGFDYRDFELASTRDLLLAFPEYAEWIRRFTRA